MVPLKYPREIFFPPSLKKCGMVEISEEEYKLAKEAHVSNCTGGTIHEIFDIGIIILASLEK